MTLDEYIEQYTILDTEMNKKVAQEYPWLQLHDMSSGEPCEDYIITMLDYIPDGWRAAFAVEMCHEIQAEYERLKREYGKELFIIKWGEKYGTFRIYFSEYTQQLDKIENKYNIISEKVCIECGRPAEFVTIDWISPYCGYCAPKKERMIKL